jgi:hypothetical protein
MSEQTWTEGEPRVLFSFTDGDKTWPFFEDEDANIIGYGHQDRAAFVAAVLDYDRTMSGEGELHSEGDVTYGYVVVNAPSECEPEYWTFSRGRPVPGQSHPEPYKASDPDVVPVTMLWWVR